MDKDYILSKIKEIIDKKLNDKTPPYHCNLIELLISVEADAKKCLNSLYFEKEIEVGNTLNSKYIKFKSK